MAYSTTEEMELSTNDEPLVITEASATIRRIQLSPALLTTIMAKLDMASICSYASTCNTFIACISHFLSFIPIDTPED